MIKHFRTEQETWLGARSLTIFVMAVLAAVLRLSVDPANAGPNADGTIILHAKPSVIYTGDNGDYCGDCNLTSCDEAVTSVAGGSVPVVFYAVASFPETSEPRLAGVTFGLDYDDTAVTLLEWGACGDFELPATGWPAPGTGTAVTWADPVTSRTVPIYWFAGYGGEDPAVLSLTVHPTQGASFGDDFVPSNIDVISGFGSLGFGSNAGYRPCPVQLLAQEEGGNGSEESPCIFPADVSIAPGTYLALETDSTTTVLTNETITVDWSPGNSLTVNGVVHYASRAEKARQRERHLPDPEVLLELYRGVPLVDEYLSAGLPITEAVRTYSNARASLSGQASAEFYASLRLGMSPLDAASMTKGVLLSSRLVRAVADPRHLGSIVIIDVEYHGREGTTSMTLPIEPARIRTRLDASRACEMLEELTQFVSVPSETTRLMILRNGSAGMRGGAKADSYIEDNR